MTCIVGLIDDSKIFMGGDSAASIGWGLTILKDPKVVRKGDFLIGSAGSSRMMTLLHHALILPEYNDDEDIAFYMATKFIDAVRECFKDGGHAMKNNEQESTGGTFLVGFKGRLFNIDSHYHTGEAACGYDAIGCANDIALGVLFATPDMQPTKRIELALRAAETHNSGVRAPFHIVSL